MQRRCLALHAIHPGASGGAECAHRQLSSNPRATCTFSSRCRPQAQPNQCANKSPQCRGLWDGARHCWREGMGVGSMRCPSSRCSAPADLPHSRSLPASCSILPGALPAPAQPHGSALEGAHSYLAPLAWPGTPLWQQQAAGWTCSRAAGPLSLPPLPHRHLRQPPAARPTVLLARALPALQAPAPLPSQLGA